VSRLDGKVAVVTGAAEGGIGAAYADRLANAGALVVIADLNEAGARAQAKLLTDAGLKAWAVCLDISDADGCVDFVATVTEREGSLDILVNNAACFGGRTYNAAEHIPLDQWHRMINVNTNGTYFMCRAVIPQMKEQRWGRIINQGSESTYSATPGGLDYCVSKATIVPMTKTLAKELGEYGINVNCISPGMVDTPAMRGMVANVDEVIKVVAGQTPLRRVGVPADLTGVLEFLCSDESAFITGQTICVGGGSTMLG
jgi:NAD(P)-dependent dehydrogenase (short-subunit alcohol dehydrogenase family)